MNNIASVLFTTAWTMWFSVAKPWDTRGQGLSAAAEYFLKH